jgi:type III restriction enzyme
LKAKAAKHWCASISGVAPPAGLDQPRLWEYLVLPESLYRANEGASFTALLPLMRQECQTLVAAEKGELFS